MELMKCRACAHDCVMHETLEREARYYTKCAGCGAEGPMAFDIERAATLHNQRCEEARRRYLAEADTDALFVELRRRGVFPDDISDLITERDRLRDDLKELRDAVASAPKLRYCGEGRWEPNFQFARIGSKYSVIEVGKDWS